MIFQEENPSRVPVNYSSGLRYHSHLPQNKHLEKCNPVRFSVVSVNFLRICSLFNNIFTLIRYLLPITYPISSTNLIVSAMLLGSICAEWCIFAVYTYHRQ